MVVCLRVCIITNTEEAGVAADAGADVMALVFVGSLRQVGFEETEDSCRPLGGAARCRLVWRLV